MSFRPSLVRGSTLLLLAAALAVPGVSSAASVPTPRTVLIQALKSMKNLHSVHTEAKITRGGPPATTALQVSADCSGTVPATITKKNRYFPFRLSSWARGTLVQGKQPQTVNDHLVIIQDGTRATAWAKTPATNGQWKSGTKYQVAQTSVLPAMCLPLNARSFGFSSFKRWMNLGTTSVDGVSAWHLFVKARATTTLYVVTELYVDRATHEIVRYGVTEGNGHGVVSARRFFDYSKFNVPVSIQPPA